MANLITGIRILASVGLLFCPAFSSLFYVLYLLAGISDMIDGPVARGTGTTSDFGAKLDTGADFLFVAVCLYKLLPALDVPVWLYVWIGLIALVKAANVVSGYVMQKHFVALHTPMNKATLSNSNTRPSRSAPWPPSPPFRRAASYERAGRREEAVFSVALRGSAMYNREESVSEVRFEDKRLLL